MHIDRPTLIALAAVIAAAVVPYLPSLDNELVFDDRFLASQDARVTEPGHLGEIWVTDYWPGDRPSYNYRPITTTSFALAGGAGTQRALKIGLHATCSVLVLVLCLVLGLGISGATVAATLFAVHPLHSEAIYLIVGRGELLAAGFGILFLIGYLRRWQFPILTMLFGAALLSKESAIMLPVLALVLDRLRKSGNGTGQRVKPAVRFLAWSVIPILVLFALRYRVFGRFLTPPGHVNPLFNPIVEMEGPWRLLNSAWIVLKYLLAMLWPLPLRADYSFDQLNLIRSLADPRLLLVIGAIVLFIVFVGRSGRGWSAGKVAALVTVLALVPVSNLFFTTGVGFGERLAYLPVVGLSLGAGFMVDRAGHRFENRPVPGNASGILLLALAVLATYIVIRRDGDWQTRDSFTAALVQDSPESAFAHGVRGAYLLELDRRLEARSHIESALEIRPSWPDAWATLAGLERDGGDLRGAARSYVRAAEALETSEFDRDEIPIYYYRAASLYLRSGECRDARRYATRSRQFLDGVAPAPLRELEQRLAEAACE